MIREQAVSVVSILGEFLTYCERENKILTSYISRSNFLTEDFMHEPVRVDR